MNHPVQTTEAPSVLQLRGLSKHFGQVIAVDQVSLTLGKGEILALLGENGAGKTTLMNMLFGHYLPDAGEIQVADENDTFHPLPLGQPQAALKAGIGMVHQHFTLAENLSVLDNILLGTERLISLRFRRKAARTRLNSMMAETGLSVPLDETVGNLSVGEKQRVEIIKALFRGARILVLDEPTAVLTPQEADSLFANIGHMATQGLSVIFISHKLREVLNFSQRLMVLRGGKAVAETRTEAADETWIAEAMVGQQTKTTRPLRSVPGPALLRLDRIEIKGRSVREKLKQVSFTVHEKEIVGLAGVSGNGQKALAELISGLRKPDAGKLMLDDKAISAFHPAAFTRAAIGRIPEDRHHHGIVGSMSVAENLILEQLDDKAVQHHGILRRQSIQQRAARACRDYDVRGPGIEAAARLLSGGNIQKLILARVFLQSPRIILANQPTRGLDFSSAAEVGRRLVEARDRGAGVLLISEDLDEIFRLSDRLLVMHDGEVQEAGPPEKLSRRDVGLMMAGEAA